MDKQVSSLLANAARLIIQGDNEAAQAILIPLIKADPSNEQAWLALSLTIRDDDEKRVAIRQALQINPDFEEARHQLIQLDQKRNWEIHQPEGLQDKDDRTLEEAERLLASGNSQAAFRSLRSYLKENPNHPEAWYLLSFADPTNRGKLAALRQTLRLNPDHPDARDRLRLIDPNAGRIRSAQVPLQSTTPSHVIAKPNALTSFFSIARYITQRVIVIALTILLGVYITVLICNKSGEIDRNIRVKIEEQVRFLSYSGAFEDVPQEEWQQALDRTEEEFAQAAGLYLHPAIKNLRWTYNALTFKWGKAVFYMFGNTARGYDRDLYEIREIVLKYFPNTLLIIGTANFIIFIAGIPLALYLASRKQGTRIDRFFSLLSPISSIPSWVHGVILVWIFAVHLGLLPYSGKYDYLPAETWIGNVLIVGKHMVLPVAAVLLGIFFQLVYSWRTFLMIYTEEDYVDLALSKGLSQTAIERRYIMRPALPYVLTSYALTLIGFWQMTTALETFFYWPGIGSLYISALPKYLDEFFYPGDLRIILSLVVIFAYLLGATVLILDLVYAWIDPRIRVVKDRFTITSPGHLPGLRTLLKRRKRSQSRVRVKENISLAKWITITFVGWRVSAKSGLKQLQGTLIQVFKYPSAVIGLVIILIFCIGSIAAVVFFPYLEIGQQWQSSNLTGKLSVPRNAPPSWINIFRKYDYPLTYITNSQDGEINKVYSSQDNGEMGIHFSMDLNYDYEEFPQDILLYIDAAYQEKRPHVTIRWLTPDGREIQPKSPSVTSENTYFFSDYLNPKVFIRKNSNWKEWFDYESQNHTPEFYVLFADPEAQEERALPGKYHLKVDVMSFEPGTDAEVEFVMLGQVFGLAGTDYLRRDLLLPLLWGLPFALAFGLVGATTTTVLGMIIAAVGAWFGGWVDGLLQRLTEINMILPVLAVGVLVYALYDVSLWVVLAIVIGLNIFSGPTKSFRAALLQVRELPYIESAQAYGASNARIIFKYMVPKIIPTLIPQLVTLIPSIVFLEATLGILNVFDPRFPTWGRVIHDALDQNALWGGFDYWVIEPIVLLLMTGLAFSMLGFALERVLNPRLQS
jgi:peptide/nickel transport system permease protein